MFSYLTNSLCNISVNMLCCQTNCVQITPIVYRSHQLCTDHTNCLQITPIQQPGICYYCFYYFVMVLLLLPCNGVIIIVTLWWCYYYCYFVMVLLLLLLCDGVIRQESYHTLHTCIEQPYPILHSSDSILLIVVVMPGLLLCVDRQIPSLC